LAREIEIKFRVREPRALTRQLRAAGFRLITRRTHEMNTLYDLPGQVLRKRKQLLRLRKYGSVWTLTHKSGAVRARHSSRVELETQVADGIRMDAILRALGYSPSFRYEKFRAEWVDGKSADGKGHVVVDETPIGNFAELEGPDDWIDRTAATLGIDPSQYITLSYGRLFDIWREQHNSSAQDLTFAAIAASPQ